MTSKVGGILAFIEVKYRSSADYGHVLQTIGNAKQHRIKLAASYFLSRNPSYHNYVIRFDVVGVSPGQLSHDPKIEWLCNAFY
jgi:putative endonuclease